MDGKTVTEGGNHLVAPVQFDLNEGLDLVDNVALGEQVARVDQFEKEVTDALLVYVRVHCHVRRLDVTVVFNLTHRGACQSCSSFITRSFA